MPAARECLNKPIFPARHSRCQRRRCQRRFWFGVLLLAALATGCSDSNSPALLPVAGRVLLSGLPLEKGSVSFRPESGQGWHQPTGLISADGTYVLYTDQRAGAPAGHYRVVVFSNQAGKPRPGTAAPGLPQSAIPSRYNRPELTPLHVDVTEHPSPAAYDLELVPDAN